MTKYFVKGKGEVNLTQRNFVAKGGEGMVYSKGGIAYKICEPGSMIPLDKLQELSVLDHPRIVRPQDPILDKKNNPVGYTMAFLNDTEPLSKFFTKAFKRRNSIDPNDSLGLVKSLFELVWFVHGKDILIVDLNELNFLVKNLKDVYAIDVNSYETKNYPATVIMESVLDRHCGGTFSKNTDWFSAAVVSLQLLIGIHPYKGGHPDFEHLPKADRMAARMKANISVFNSKSTLPPVCLPFDVIPGGLRQWYVSVLENGERLAPPKDFAQIAAVVVTQIKKVTGTDLFDIEEIASFVDPIYKIYYGDGTRVVITDKELLVGKKNHPIADKNTLIGFTPKMNIPVGANIENGQLRLFDITHQKQLSVSAHAKSLLRCDGRLYSVTGAEVFEIKFNEIGNQIMPTMRHVGNVLDVPDATQVQDGAIVQNLLGRYVFSIFPRSDSSQQINVKELDEYKVIEAKYENNVLVVIATNIKTGKYSRFVLRFSDTYDYDIREVEDINYSGLNFTVSDAGVCVMINEDGKIEAFSNKKGSSQVKIMDIPDSDIILHHEGSRIMFAKGNKLYKLSMK